MYFSVLCKEHTSNTIGNHLGTVLLIVRVLVLVMRLVVFNSDFKCGADAELQMSDLLRHCQEFSVKLKLTAGGYRRTIHKGCGVLHLL